jgi:hypothetical protein
MPETYKIRQHKGTGEGSRHSSPFCFAARSSWFDFRGQLVQIPHSRIPFLRQTARNALVGTALPLIIRINSIISHVQVRQPCGRLVSRRIPSVEVHDYVLRPKLLAKVANDTEARSPGGRVEAKNGPPVSVRFSARWSPGRQKTRPSGGTTGRWDVRRYG